MTIVKSISSKGMRHPKNNTLLTGQLFQEQWICLNVDERVVKPTFSLYEDKPGLINARKTFVEMGDPTGYLWAEAYLEGWTHWQKLAKIKWFQEALAVWLEELSIKMRAEAIAKIREIAESNTQGSLAAAKFLATEEYNKHTRGRPSKAELRGELKKQVERLSIEDEDAQRIGLRVIK